MQKAPTMAHLTLAVALDVAAKRGFGDLTNGRPQLAAWMRSMCALPSMQKTAPPDAIEDTFDVRFWHKADMAIVFNDVRFWG
jgi:glutathione S-transferase